MNEPLRAPIALVAWTGWLTIRSSIAPHRGRHTSRNLKAVTHA